jgi:tRNA U38,U39,U40 pseudouridine synthase TruA
MEIPSHFNHHSTCNQGFTRLLFFCSYIGRHYSGFQRQVLKGRDIPTVQFDLEQMLKKVLNQEVPIRACSRTD